MSISVIVPCYNEDASIKLFLDKFYEVMNKNNFSSFEVIFVNDGSEDKTTETINNYAKIDKRIKLISFSRNFQKEAAMLAGLDNAKADAIVVIDADLQHPIDAIALFYQKIKEGYNIVYGVKKSRNYCSLKNLIFSCSFYRMYNLFSKFKMPLGASDFVMFDKKVLETLKSYREKVRFMRGIFYSIGYKKVFIEYEVCNRKSGVSKWNFRSLMNLAFDGIFSSSTLPLRCWLYIGALVSFISVSIGIYFIVKTLYYGIDVAGHASLLVFISFLGGVELFILGVLGEYIGRIYWEVKQRPSYIIDEMINIE